MADGERQRHSGDETLGATRPALHSHPAGVAGALGEDSDGNEV
jgi:hypothetical protein